MFLLSILFGRLPGFDFKTIGFLPIDAFTQETITYQNEITENPIEFGGVVSDHIYAKPTGLRVTGVVRGGRRGLAYQLLVAMHQSRIPLFVVSGLQTFTNMAIKELIFPREVETADSLQFTAEFRQLRFAFAASAAASTSTPSATGGAANTAAPTANAGRAQAAPASPANAAAAQGTAANTGAAPSGSFLSRATGVGQ
jgi:hypothetical protein